MRVSACVVLLYVAVLTLSSSAAPACDVEEAPPLGVQQRLWNLFGAFGRHTMAHAGVNPEASSSPTSSMTSPASAEFDHLEPPPSPYDVEEDVTWAPVERSHHRSSDEGEEVPSVTSFSRTASFPPRRPAPEATALASASRQSRVKLAMAHAWGGYKKFAWGEDELEPLSQTGITSFGMGLTLVDSLDTLIVMGLDEEVALAIDWIDRHLAFGEQEEINLFEVTIRVLGGLLSAYEATGHASLLSKADELGQKMLFAFHTPHGLPFGTIGLRSKTRYNPKWSRGACTVAEVATLQLEFRALSRHTGDPVYEAVAQRVMDHLRKMPTRTSGPQAWPADLPHGLYPMFISPETGLFLSNEVTLGARADSLYEYLLKQWLLSGQTDQRMRDMYETSVASIRQHLVRRGGAGRCGNCTYLASWNHRTKTHKDQMDHLACFAPGMLALGAHGESYEEDMQLAAELMETCYRMYADSPTGLAAEIADFAHPTRVTAATGAKHCLLRPETSESLFLMWRLTGEKRYREWGWELFEAFETHTRVPSGGFVPLHDVGKPHSQQKTGRMESFFTAETLKYLFLLFGDGAAYPLDEYVFNTEAHPLRIRPEYAWGAKWGSLPALSEIDALAAAAMLMAKAEGGSSNGTAAQRLAAASEENVATHNRMREHAEARAALLSSMPTMVGA